MKKILLLLACLVLGASAATAPGETWTIPIGAKLTISATADGVPAPSLMLYRNELPIGEIPATGFVINPVTAQTAGIYFVRATNAIGSADSASVIISVYVPAAPTNVAISYKIGP